MNGYVGAVTDGRQQTARRRKARQWDVGGWTAHVGGQQWVVRWAEAAGGQWAPQRLEGGGWVMGWKMTEGWTALGGMLGS